MPISRTRPPERIPYFAFEEADKAIPNTQSMMLPLPEPAGSTQIHRVRNAVDRPTDLLEITDEERCARSSEGISHHGLTTASLLRASI